MTLINKRFLVLMLTVAVVLMSANFAFANGLEEKKQIESIKLSVEKSFNGHKGALEVDKKNFGLSDSESFSNATLGNGFPFYVISSVFLNSQSSENAFSFGGYVFPIKVGKKAAGIVVVREINGKWDIAEMINNFTFEQDIADAKKIFKDNSTTKLIFDDYFHLYALVVQNNSGYNILPIRDNETFDLKKHQVKSLEESAEKIRTYHKERIKDKMKLGGGTDETTRSQDRNLNYIIIGLTIIAVSAASFSVIKKRKNVT